MDKQAFFDGTMFDAYRWFGVHLEGDTAVFRTFAPNASRITVTGACNGWGETGLTQDGRSGFWEGRVTGAAAGQFYKYRIYGANGTVTEHCLWLCDGAAAGLLLGDYRIRRIYLHRCGMDEKSHCVARRAAEHL